MTSQIVSIFKSNKDNVPTCDSRKLTQAIGIEHKKFFRNVILKHQGEIERETNTPIVMLSEDPGTKGGHPVRYAQLKYTK